MSETFWRSPIPCPKCQAERARPRRVESRTAAEVIVQLCCEACGHEWTAVRNTPWLGKTPDKRTPPEEPV